MTKWQRDSTAWEPEPSSIGWPSLNTGRADGTSAERSTHTQGSNELRKTDTQVSKSSIHTKSITLLALGVKERNVTHGRSEGTATSSTEESSDKKDGERTFWVRKSNTSQKHGNAEANTGTVDDIASSSGLSHERVWDTQSTSRKSGDGRKQV